MPNLPEIQTSSYPPPVKPRAEITLAVVNAVGLAVNSTVQADPRSQAALAAAKIEEPVENELLKAVGGVYGDTCCALGGPEGVNATALELLSTSVLDGEEPCRVNKAVAAPVIAAMLVPADCVAVSKAVGGVNGPV